MRPLELKIKAFGSYVEEQTVDFEKLSRSGIFLIKGDTGSGKTTIFDAMTFALYGGSSGESSRVRNGRNDLEEWRCTQAAWKDETVVSFTFAVRGRKYRFTRSLVPKRTSLSLALEAGELDDYGNLIPFFENPKIADLNSKAEELIGLTKEQFRQVVLLPQGQFERFLTASSNEKQGILEKIFGVDRWARYADSFFEKAEKRKKDLDTQKEDVLRALREENAENVEALLQIVETLQEDREQLGKAHLAFDGEGKRKALEEDRRLAEAFGKLHEQEAAVSGLLAKEPEIQALKKTCGEAEKAESLRGCIEEYEKTGGEWEKRKRELAEKEKALPGAKMAAESAGKDLKEHAEHSPVAELTAKIGMEESKRPIYRNYAGLRKAFEEQEKRRDQAEKEAKKAETELTTATKRAAEAKTAYDEADARARLLRDRYFSGIYGEIAGTLQEGEPCPVCGSAAHPHPAEKSADSVDKDTMDRAQEEADGKKALWSDAEEARQTADTGKKEKDALLTRAQMDLRSAKTALASAEENLIDGVGDETALQKLIDGQRERIKQYNDKTDELKCASDAANTALTALKTSLTGAAREEQEAEERYRVTETALREALREKGYPDLASARGKLVSAEERNRMRERIVEHDTKLATAREELENRQIRLSGKTEPDALRFEERDKEIREEERAFHQALGKLTTEIDRLQKKQRELARAWTDYKANIQQAAEDYELARKLRGDTGIGLQRYVLAVMFGQVIGEANRMLDSVHGGRYHLFRTDERGTGNKRGLELKVHDNRSPEKEGRSVSLLSGGEKFLVSLALSIGMSAVAQRSGVQIEALFIDEGFGTLDNSSIQDALTVLEGVRRSSGMIGIISHVALLEGAIQTQLRVVKRETGSTIVME
ncbi:MAG: SMC family ATPase [Oscillospiraceae bacterium]|nr:SMC family ATPase [Oscillospiraceae bacterium]